MTQDACVRISVRGASALFMLQVFTRLATFVMNQILFRFVSPQVLGITGIELELLLSTILFLSREGFRLALLRAPSSSTAEKLRVDDRQIVVNESYIPIVLGAATSILCCGYYLTDAATTAYRSAVLLYGAAALLELVSEPLFVQLQRNFWLEARAKAEGLAVLARCTTILGVVIVQSKSAARDSDATAITAFAVGQLAYSLVLLTRYAAAYVLKGRASKPPTSLSDIIPRPVLVPSKNSEKEDEYERLR